MAKLTAFIVLSLFLTACSSKKSSSSSGGSDGSSEASPDAEVTISASTAVNITSSNVASYTLSGTCSINGQPVTIVFASVTPTEQPTCTDKAWTQTYDLTQYDLGLAVTITASHKAVDESTTDQVAKRITNSFVCSTGWVAVPPLAGYTDKAFCVMKYEAKDVGGTPTSQVDGTPWVSITQADAATECQSLGSPNYDLITNDEWQTIARNIEGVASNWSGGTVGSAGGLNIGHSDRSPNSLIAASSNDNSACEGTEQTCDGSTWNGQRRTHKLSNGKVIWDMAGNAYELVKDKYDDASTTWTPYNYLSQVTDTTHGGDFTLTGGTASRTRKMKAHMGPAGDYTALSTAPYGGLGKLVNPSFTGRGEAADRTFVRGGSFRSNGDASGVFATYPNLPLATTDSEYGFRCVHHP